MNSLAKIAPVAVDLTRQAGGLVATNEKLLTEIVWPHFWAIQIILLVLILTYCIMHELSRVIGRKKVLQIFFGPMPNQLLVRSIARK